MISLSCTDSVSGNERNGGICNNCPTLTRSHLRLHQILLRSRDPKLSSRRNGPIARKSYYRQNSQDRCAPNGGARKYVRSTATCPGPARFSSDDPSFDGRAPAVRARESDLSGDSLAQLGRDGNDPIPQVHLRLLPIPPLGARRPERSQADSSRLKHLLAVAGVVSHATRLSGSESRMSVADDEITLSTSSAMPSVERSARFSLNLASAQCFAPRAFSGGQAERPIPSTSKGRAMPENLLDRKCLLRYGFGEHPDPASSVKQWYRALACDGVLWWSAACWLEPAPPDGLSRHR